MANIYDSILSGSFASLGMPPAPKQQPGMMGRGLPSDRLAPSPAGLPNPSPGSGLTPAQIAQMGGWSVNNQTGALGYAAPSPSNPAASAAAGLGAGSVGLPRPRPGNAPTSIDMAAINGQPAAVSGTMKPNGFGGLLGLLTGGLGGGLMEQLTGPSKNGLGGLAGLMGGPQQGGLLQMLFGGGQGSQGTPTPRASAPSYVAQGGALMPLTSMGGGTRRLDGDSGGGPSTGTNVNHHEGSDLDKAHQARRIALGLASPTNGAYR